MKENGILRALNFKFSWGAMPLNPPSLVDANHSRKILDPPLYLYWIAATVPHGDGDMLEAMWKSVTNHIQDIHDG